MKYYTYFVECQYESNGKVLVARTIITCDPADLIKKMDSYLLDVHNRANYEVVKLIRISDGIEQR